jgi:hypothetical protein
VRDFLINLAASVVFFCLLALAGWATVIWKRRRLLRFFGVLTNRRLTLYWSHLRVARGGAIGVDGIARSYSGSAVPAGEALVLRVYQRLFTSIVPGLDDPSGLLRRIALADVELDTQVARITAQGTDSASSFVALGSPTYNGASGWIETALTPVARFINDNQSIEVAGNPPFSGPLHGFVQRRRIGDGLPAAFYAAGMSEGATVAAALFLASRWAYLHRRYGTRENFCVVLKANPENPNNPRILLERGEG